jgi:hypothetical protein
MPCNEVRGQKYEVGGGRLRLHTSDFSFNF